MVRERLLAIVDRFDDFVHNEPTFGPGRFDTFNPAKALLNWNFDQIPERERIGVVDFPSVFLQGPKTGMQLHWDGNNTKVSERNRSAAFGTGATPPILDRASLKRMEDWLAVAEPPRFADVFPGQFDPALAAAGRAGLRPRMRRLPRRLGPRLHRRVRRQGHPDRRDRHRPRPARQLHPRSRGQPERRSTPTSATSASRPSARPTATPTRPLDGLWLRAPYLHNGSVPTLEALLCPAGRAPRRRSCAATTSTTRERWAS